MQKRQIRRSEDSTPHSTPVALLGVLVWLALSLLSVREANTQGSINFTNRISGSTFNQTTLALAGLGAAMLMIARRRR